MEQTKKSETHLHADRIEGDKLILDSKGQFPKRLIILLEPGKVREYRIIRTRNGGYILN